MLRILVPERTKQIALAWSILNDAQLAEDAYQDMLAKAFEHEATFEGPRHLRDWSWKVLRNRCYELIRKRKSRAALLDETALELIDTELESRESDQLGAQTEALQDCLQTLTENARNVVRLRFFEGMRGDEVAAKLGRKPDAVYKALQRIYATLGECIRQKVARAETEGSVS